MSSETEIPQTRAYTSSHDGGDPTATSPPSTTYDDPQTDYSGQPPPTVGDPRSEMISQTVMGRNDSITKAKKVVQIIVNLIEIILVCVLVPLHWDRYCNRPLRVFLIARASTDALHILNHIWSINSPQGCAKVLRTILSLVEYGFVLFAMIEFGEVKSCNGSTLGLSITFVIITFIPLIMPFLFICLICCCLPCLLRAMVRWAELQDAPEGATEANLDSLERFQWTPTLFKEHHAAAAIECPICMIEYDEDSSIIILPCHHGLHAECLVSWLKLNKTCPMCRSDPFDAASPHPDLRETAEARQTAQLRDAGYSPETIASARASVNSSLAKAKAEHHAERESAAQSSPASPRSPSTTQSAPNQPPPQPQSDDIPVTIPHDDNNQD